MILVVGSTGMLGGMITQQLLAQGKVVRILVRNGSNYQHLVNAGAKPVMGDLKDRASLNRACEGVDVVITTANAAQRGGEDNFETVDHQGNINLIDAAKAANVKQFIFISALGASPDSPNPLLKAKYAAESHLKASGLPYTIIMPNIFMEVWVGLIVGMPLQTGLPISIIGQGERKHAFISITDVAAYAVAAVGHKAAINQVLPIGGPQNVSWMDIIHSVESALGHPLTVNHLQHGEMLPNLPPEVTGLMTVTDTFDSPMDMTALSKAFAIPGVTIDMVLKHMFQHQ